MQFFQKTKEILNKVIALVLLFFQKIEQIRAIVARFFQSLRETKPVRAINEFINSKYMLAVLALLTLLSNIFGLEVLTYTVVALIFYYICLFGKDFLLLAPVFVFMYISPSEANHPFFKKESIFYPENGLWILIAAASVFVVLFLFRIITDGSFVRLFTQKRSFIWGLLLLGVIFTIGGLGYEKYTFSNLSYALALFAAFFIPYFLVTATVQWEDVPKDYFAWMCLFIGFTVAIELLGVYALHYEKIFVDGELRRNYLYTGWGTYTSMSIVLLMCMPAAFYMAATKKYGFVFNILGNILFLAVVATNCRGSILFGAIIYVLCAALVLLKKENRIQNLIVYATVVLFALIVLIATWGTVTGIITGFLEQGDSGREGIFKDAVESFKENPIFGQGFYDCIADYHNPAGATFIPTFWHNTFLQMLAACGAIGLGVYLFHRIQTVVVFVKKPSYSKTFVGVCIFALLIACMMDCHIFNLGVTLFYSVLLTFGEKQGEMQNETEKDLLLSLFQKHKKVEEDMPASDASDIVAETEEK